MIGHREAVPDKRGDQVLEVMEVASDKSGNWYPNKSSTFTLEK